MMSRNQQLYMRQKRYFWEKVKLFHFLITVPRDIQGKIPNNTAARTLLIIRYTSTNITVLLRNEEKLHNVILMF